LKIAKFSCPHVFCTPAEGVPFGIGYDDDDDDDDDDDAMLY